MAVIPFIPTKINQTALYMSGLQATWISNTQMQIAVGHCNDSTGQIDMDILNPITFDITKKGINGIDTGIIVNASCYALYIIADSSGFNPVGIIAHQVTNGAVALPVTPITLPDGYDAARLRMYFITTSAGLIKKFYFMGNNNIYTMQYDGLNATHPTVDNTLFAPYNLLPDVPPAPCVVAINSSFVPNSPGDFFKYRPMGSIGLTAPVQSASVGSFADDAEITSMIGQTGTSWGIDVLVSTASSTLQLSVVYYNISV